MLFYDGIILELKSRHLNSDIRYQKEGLLHDVIPSFDDSVVNIADIYIFVFQIIANDLLCLLTCNKYPVRFAFPTTQTV